MLHVEDIFFSAELDGRGLTRHAVQTLNVESEIEHGDIASLVEEDCADRNVVRIEILFKVNLEVGQHTRDARAVCHKFVEQNFCKARRDVERDCIGEYVDEQACRIGILLVGILVSDRVGRNCRVGCVV